MAFAENPYGFAANAEETNVDAPPISFKVVGQPNAAVDFEAASPVNKTIPADVYGPANMTAEGVLTQYLVNDLHSYMQVKLSSF